MPDEHTAPNIPIDKNNSSAVKIVCELTNPFEVGSCQMNGGALVTLSLDNPDFEDPNNPDPKAATVTWIAKVFSRHIQLGDRDRWHQSFNFKTRSGTSVVQTGELDGPDMENANEEKEINKEKKISVDPDLFPSIRFVDWTGKC